MKTKDTLTLIRSKLKIRKLRTTITITTASTLFGVIIAILLIAKGFFNNLATLSKTTYGNDTILSISHETTGYDIPEVQAKAIELYNASSDENKQNPIITPGIINGTTIPPYLDMRNPFTIAAASTLIPKQIAESKSAVTELIKPYGGKVIGTISNYCINTEQIFIEKLTQPEYSSSIGCFINIVGTTVKIIEGNVLNSFIKITEQKDDVIQIVTQLESAAKLLGISAPNYHNPNPATSLKDFINAVNQQAIGLQFAGDMINGDKITYEIVGLLPPKGISTINPRSINPIESTTHTELGSDTSWWPSEFIVTNPDSTAFKTTYTIDIDTRSNNILASFPSNQFDQLLYEEDQLKIGQSEFISNRRSLNAQTLFIDKTIIAFTIIFSIIATIIMIGTIARIIDDERQTIALYRTVGATTKNILQVFTGYIFTLSTLIAICSTIIGLTLAAIITATHTDLITANVSALYNIPNLQPLIFIAFDPRILIIIAIIIVVGLICLLLTLDKLVSKNIVRDLRK